MSQPHHLAPCLLAQRLQQDQALLAPGVYDALTALVAQQAGFEAVYLSGASVAYTRLGRSDIGLTTATEVAQTLVHITDRVSIPVIVDADTGFGNELNVHHTVRTLERAGANAIQIEDQQMPKKCGHFNDKSVIPAAEAASKIKAAVDARSSDDFLIIARTDAIAVEGFDSALERAQRFIAAGADMTFVEAPGNIDQLRRIPQTLSAPQLVNVVIGGKTPTLDAGAFGAMGFGLVLYANAALQGAVRGMTQALRQLKASGRLDEDSGLVATFAERQRLVRKDYFDALV